MEIDTTDFWFGTTFDTSTFATFDTSSSDYTSTFVPSIFEDDVKLDWAWWGDVYFYGACAEHGPISFVLNVVGIIICSISFVIVLTISTLTIQKLRTKSSMSNLLKCIFYLSMFGSLILLIGLIWMYMACFIYEMSYSSLIAAYITTLGYYLYIDCILATLVARLYTTFKRSAFEMSKTTKIAFLILLCLLCALFIVIMVFNALLLFGVHTVIKKQNIWTIEWSLYVVKIVFYAICSVAAVYIFCRNLFALTLLQTQSATKSMTPSGLSKSQKQMIFTASKYVGLFLVAILSTLIPVIFNGASHFAPLPFQVTTISYACDGVINIICICLQFAWANKYYLKWCKCIDDCCGKLMKGKASRSVSQINRQNNKDGYEFVKTHTTETDTDHELDTNIYIHLFFSESARIDLVTKETYKKMHINIIQIMKA